MSRHTQIHTHQTHRTYAHIHIQPAHRSAVIDSVELDTNIYVVTEQVTPLDELLQSLRTNTAALAWGLYQVTVRAPAKLAASDFGGGRAYACIETEIHAHTHAQTAIAHRPAHSVATLCVLMCVDVCVCTAR